AAADVPGQARQRQWHTHPGADHHRRPGRHRAAGHAVQVTASTAPAGPDDSVDGPGGVVTESPPAAIDVQEVGWTIGGATILADINLQIGKGELVAVIGPNGAGKSTLVN